MRPTQEDVARLAGVSRALVSLVVRNATNVSDESRARVLAACEELGYSPNAFARSLASKDIRTIGVLINDVTNPYFAHLFESFAKVAAEHGYDILTAPGTRSAHSEMRLVDTLLEHRVSGLALLSPLMSTKDLRRIANLSPTVVIGRQAGLPGLDMVTTDEVAAAREVVQHLYDRGHRHIAHITGGPGNQPSKAREAAFRSITRDFGIDATVVEGSFTEDGGKKGASALLGLGKLPTAIVAANDLCAVGAMGVMRAAGLRIPDEISLIGYDDSQIAQLDLVQLTSVQQAVEGFGSAAMTALIARVADPGLPRSVQLLPARLMERTTVAAVPA